MKPCAGGDAVPSREATEGDSLGRKPQFQTVSLPLLLADGVACSH